MLDLNGRVAAPDFVGDCAKKYDRIGEVLGEEIPTFGLTVFGEFKGEGRSEPELVVEDPELSDAERCLLPKGPAVLIGIGSECFGERDLIL
jgi:hypothetical protein